MVSDAVHSASDIFSTLIVMVGLRLSGKAPDREHPYGHERMECVAAIVLAVVLLITGLLIGYAGVKSCWPQRGDKPVPGVLALAAAIVSIAVKEGMFWYTRAHARRLASPALMADAWHHRSDALSSVGALVGIAGARMGVPMLDPLASVVICAFIAKAAFDIFRDAVDKMVDHSCDEETEARHAVHACRPPGRAAHRPAAHPGVRQPAVHRAGDRPGRRADPPRAHAIAEAVHDDVERAFPEVKHIMIHVNPAGGRNLKQKIVINQLIGGNTHRLKPSKFQPLPH